MTLVLAPKVLINPAHPYWWMANLATSYATSLPTHRWSWTDLHLHVHRSLTLHSRLVLGHEVPGNPYRVIPSKRQPASVLPTIPAIVGGDIHRSAFYNVTRLIEVLFHISLVSTLDIERDFKKHYS